VGGPAAGAARDGRGRERVLRAEERKLTVIDKIAWVRIEDGRILCVRSRNREAWYLPGGKREQGETDVDTLVRETAEELRVRVLPETARHVGTFEAQADGRPDGVTVRMTCYTADHEGTASPDHEIAEMRWFGHAERELLSPAARVVADHLAGLALLR
jgi:8-oxo-dGTP diphosphatase